MQPQQVFFKLRERQSHLLARKKTPVNIRKRDVEACVLTPSIPAGRCVGAVWVAYWACQRYHHLCLTQQATRYKGYLELKKCFFKRACFGCGDFSGVLIGTKSLFFVSVPFDAGLKVMPHTASRCSLLSTVRSSGSRRRLARGSTRRVL